jgi:hypothetical protein
VGGGLALLATTVGDGLSLLAMTVGGGLALLAMTVGGGLALLAMTVLRDSLGSGYRSAGSRRTIWPGLPGLLTLPALASCALPRGGRC